MAPLSMQNLGRKREGILWPKHRKTTIMGREELKTKKRTSPLIRCKELGPPLLAHGRHHLLQPRVTCEGMGTTVNLELAISLANQLCSQGSFLQETGEEDWEGGEADTPPISGN